MNSNSLYSPYHLQFQTLQSHHKIAYIEEGNLGNPILLFIHGMGGFIPNWSENISSLSNQFHCIAIDLPGHGLSDKNNESFSLVFYAEVIADFIESKGLSNSTIHLCGHSMGGQIALILSLRFGQLFSKIVLIAPAGIEKFSASEKMMLKNSMQLLRFAYSDSNSINTLIRSFFYKFPKLAESMLERMSAVLKKSNSRHYSSMVVRSAQSMLDTPIEEFLSQITIPTLIIFGENDNLIPNPFLNHGSPSDIAKKGLKSIKDSEMHLIKQAGHFVHFEKSKEVNALMLTFLS